MGEPALGQTSLLCPSQGDTDIPRDASAGPGLDQVSQAIGTWPERRIRWLSRKCPGHGVQESYTGPCNLGGDSAPSRTRWAGGHFARFQAASVASACSFLLPGRSLSPDLRPPAHWGDSGRELCKGDRASSPDALGARPGRGPPGPARPHREQGQDAGRGHRRSGVVGRGCLPSGCRGPPAWLGGGSGISPAGGTLPWH